MITDSADYFSKGCGRCERFGTPDCSTRRWIGGLEALRALCLEAGLLETAKWGHPCYSHAGRNIVILGAFRDNFRLTFFNAALLTENGALLERQGPNTSHPDTIRFTDNAAPGAMRPSILAALREAKAHAEAGNLPQRPVAALALPAELVDALNADPEMAEAFHALTPGRQKSYVINLNSTKTPATRIARLEKFRSKIIEGKGALDR